MARAIYQVRLVLKPELEDEFNAWYENEYMPNLMEAVPHFYSARRLVGELNGERVYITEYETSTEDLAIAIAEMRTPERQAINAEFYAWKDRGISVHESVQLEERLFIRQPDRS
jgi:uncharacterized NAD(P)/FAD-binding protein YdhS